MLVRFDGRDLTMASRNDKPQEALFPDVAAALRAALRRPAEPPAEGTRHD